MLRSNGLAALNNGRASLSSPLKNLVKRHNTHISKSIFRMNTCGLMRNRWVRTSASFALMWRKFDKEPIVSNHCSIVNIKKTNPQFDWAPPETRSSEQVKTREAILERLLGHTMLGKNAIPFGSHPDLFTQYVQQATPASLSTAKRAHHSYTTVLLKRYPRQLYGDCNDFQVTPL